MNPRKSRGKNSFYGTYFSRRSPGKGVGVVVIGVPIDTRGYLWAPVLNPGPTARRDWRKADSGPWAFHPPGSVLPSPRLIGGVCMQGWPRSAVRSTPIAVAITDIGRAASIDIRGGGCVLSHAIRLTPFSIIYNPAMGAHNLEMRIRLCALMWRTLKCVQWGIGKIRIWVWYTVARSCRDRRGRGEWAGGHRQRHLQYLGPRMMARGELERVRLPRTSTTVHWYPTL